MAEFKFKFRLEYCSEIESTLYGLEFAVDAPDHAVQLKSPNRAVCLLCGKALEMPLTQTSVHEHFATRHDVHEAFDYYHKVFMDLPETEQSFQIYFNPSHVDKVKCEICNAKIKADDIIKHVAVEKLRNRSRIQSDYFEFASESFDDHISLNNLQTVAEHEHPLIIQRVGTADICLLCQKVLKMSPELHLKSTVHQLHLNEVNLSHLHRFHVFWQGQPDSAQNYRRYFHPRGVKTATCVFCGGCIKYAKLIEHATQECPCALLQPDNPLCEPEMNWEEKRVLFLKLQLDFPLNYEEDIRVIYYPTNLMNEVQKVDNVPLFTIQRQLENTRCLLCRKLFIGVVTMGAILSHLRSKEHRAMSYNAECLLSLALYHRFWSEQTPNLQVKQHTFIPHSAEQFKCDKCKSLVKPDEVVQHLNTCQAKASNKTDVGRPLSDEENYDLEEEEAMSLLQTKEFTNAKYAASEEPATSRPEQNFSTCLYDYDAATITKLYSSFNRCKNERRPTMYFMQKRSSRERYCLCCKRSLVGPALEHLKGRKHLKNYEDPAKISVIHAYHTYWSSQPPELQLDQVNFAPLTEDSMTCLTCNADLHFDQIKGHTCTQLLKSCQENGALPKQYQNSRSRCHESVVKKFYSKSFMGVQNKLFGSDMPLGLHWLGKISCLLCGKRLLRDLAVWHQHLITHHVKPSIDPGLLEAVKLYHQFWAEQSLEHQIMQVNFVPNTISTMKCCKRHVVNFADVTRHRCDQKNLDKLVKAVRKLTIGQDAAGPVEKSGVAEDAASTSRASAPVNVPPAVNGSNASSPAKNSPAKKKAGPVKNGTTNNVNKEEENSSGQHEIIPSTPPRERPDEVLLPYRLRHHVKYMTRFGDKTRCTACDQILYTRVGDILHHLSHPDHLRAANLALPPYGYLCEICGWKVHGGEGKWTEHMESTAHAAVVDKLGVVRRSKLEEYECLSCKLVIFGDALSIIRHKELYKVKREKKNLVSIDPKVMEQVHRLFQSPKATDAILNELLTESNKALDDDDAMQECLGALELAISKKYPDCRAHPFGSRVTGIGNESSDLDVFMDIGDMYMGKENQESKQQQAIVVTVKNILMEDKANFADILPIPSARTPIVRVVHVATTIDCDLSFRNGLSVENTQYIKFCLHLQPKTRCALLLLKRWADIVSLKDEVTSYALCMMLIFHLQLEEYLLSVDELRGLTTREVRLVDGWEIVDYSKPIEDLKKHVKEYKGDVYSLLRAFFKTYSDFDFDNELVCPLLGRTIFINQFSEMGSSLPEAMRSYKTRVQDDPDCQFKYKTSMCVQDPFDLGHNLTKAVPKAFRNKFKTLCSLTHKHMNNA